MTQPIAKNATSVAIMSEVTEGVYVAPASGGDFIAVLDGIESSPERELVEREVLTSSIGKVTPRVGLESANAAVPVEAKASGTEGGTPESGLLIQAALGATRSITTTTTTKAAGNTGSVLQIEDADISKFNLYDILVVKESGAHHVCFVTAKTTGVGTATITVSPSKPSGVFSNSVVISKNKMYYTANTGHPTISLSVYWAGEILQKSWGMRVSQLNLADFTTGQIGKWETSLQGLAFDRVNASPAFTPAPDSALPPIVVSQACVYQNGVALKVNNVSLNVSNEVSFVEDICNGRSASRMTGREVQVSYNPYMDDTDIGQFTKFDAQTEYTLFAYAANPSGVAGELEMGSVFGFVLPKCLTTEIPTGDIDGLLTDDITAIGSRGSDGATEELYIGFI
jgi:hypothetical protein